MVVAERADTFVVGVSVEQPHDTERPWLDVHRFGQLWKIPECTRGCRVRYRYLLADGAGTWRDISLGAKEHGVTLAPPSTWLLRPAHAPAGTALRFRVTSPPGETFVSGVFPATDSTADSRVYEAHVGDFLQLPYSAFGPLTVHEIAGGTATLAFLPGSLPEAKVVAWAERSLAAVRGFYGRPPVTHVLILVRATAGDEVGSGSTMGYSGASIVVNVGSETTDAGFMSDWVLVHELVHTALPDLPEEQHWLEEGLATYVEPLARYRAGLLSAEDVWGEWAEKMRLGEPEQGDEGLDRTHTWGRTYWGGALFCLAADVEIRTRTGGKASLETGLRGIVDAGGNIGENWPTEKVIEVADRATGTTVLRETYDTLAKSNAPVDLPTLWHRLGVVAHGSSPVTFDDSAELAWLRKQMTPPR
jgi:predicted metalloprotease with PDZ domain